MGAGPRTARLAYHEGVFTLSSRGSRAGVAHRGAWFAGILIALWLALVASPAAAHDTLLDSYPQAGETLTEVPEEIALDFSGEISELGVQFMVTGPEGRDVITGTPTVEGTMATQGLAEELVDGDYVIAWRVTSSDGHPISGEIPFTLAAGNAGGTGEDGTGDAETTDEATATDDAAATTGPGSGTENTDGADTTEGGAETGTENGAETDADAADQDPVATDNEIPAWGWAVAALAVVGLVACGFLAFRHN